MNNIEQIVYNKLKRNPALKLLIRDIYQQILDVIPVSTQKASYPVNVREGYFFGFHDHTPFSVENNMLAACQYPNMRSLRMPKKNDRLKIGYFNGNGFQDWHEVAETKAWNWHQGCKLQWQGENRALVFNDHVDGKNVARIVDVESGASRIIPECVSSVSADGNFAVGYNFERVNKYMPGYGYPYKVKSTEIEKKRPDQDGLYIIDLKKNDKRYLHSIAEVADMIKNEPSSDDAYHYHSHALFSPSNNRLAFLHRWIHDDVRERWSKIVTTDINGKDIKLYPNVEMASHMAWQDDSHLIAYCRLPDKRDRYVLFNDDEPQDYEIVGADIFNSDGHPFFDPTGKFFVTDSYPDRFRRQGLYLYSYPTRQRYEIARLKTFKRFATLNPYKHWSCDLHPRMDRIGRFLCFDATYTGKRALCTIDLGKPVASLKKIKSISA